ncbi:WEB family protein [Asbolus verrucosus]|uniref:WEB family protein n=1 Tax=Asbolus verrucosus TaxID=1661398 RepID=A0A482VJ07_ASBVE|nr:WEB family protein [Asbolus verrucosus]
MNNLDDYDFTPSASSNLASLFDSPSASPEASSLIYTAPKQPKFVEPAEPKSEPPKADSAVICARVVQVWKLIDNKYIAIGKHGLAIIGSSTQNCYEVILYREKRNVIVRIKICSSFEVSLKKDDFASFYDSLKENWLIKFSSSDDCTAVLSYIEKFGGKVVAVTEKNETLHQTANASEVVTNGDNPENKAKADILSRIAKMGQSILPSKNVDVDTEHNFRDADNMSIASDESQHVIPSSTTTEVMQLPKQHILPPSTATEVMQVPKQHFQNVPNTFVIGQPMGYDPLNLYLAESRTQNTEIRINLSQISEKMNHILKLVDTERASDGSNDLLKSKIKVLDLRVENLSKELKTYQDENNKLKLQINQQENVLKNEEQYQAELTLLKQQKAAQISDFERQIITYTDNIKDLTETVEKQKIEVEGLKAQLEQCQDKGQLEDEIIDLKLKLKHFEENQQLDQENKETAANFIAVLKDSMNEMYGKIMANFDEDKNYQTSEVSSIIAQNIKSTTLKIIQNFQQIYNNESEKM